jgi:hypothetical protein
VLPAINSPQVGAGRSGSTRAAGARRRLQRVERGRGDLFERQRVAFDRARVEAGQSQQRPDLGDGAAGRALRALPVASDTATRPSPDAW